MTKKMVRMELRILCRERSAGVTGTYTEYGIYEVYYDKDGNVIHIPDKIVQMTGNNPQHLVGKLRNILSSIDNQPFLRYDELIKEIKK